MCETQTEFLSIVRIRQLTFSLVIYFSSNTIMMIISVRMKLVRRVTCKGNMTSVHNTLKNKTWRKDTT